MSIARVDTAASKGYQVRVMRQGKLHSRFFRYKKDALVYERHLLDTLGPPKSTKGRSKGAVKTNTGVARIVETVVERSGRNPVAAFIVYWRTPDGSPRKSQVSIEKHGREKAFRLAKRIKRDRDREQLQ